MLYERQLPGDGAPHTVPTLRCFSRNSVVFLARWLLVSMQSVPLLWKLEVEQSWHLPGNT